MDITEEESPLLAPMIHPQLPCVLFGKGGAGKSTLAAAVAMSLQTGAELVPGWRPSVRAPVLILDFEAISRRWDWTIKALAAGAGIEPPGLAYRAQSRPHRGRFRRHRPAGQGGRRRPARRRLRRDGDDCQPGRRSE